MLKFIYNKPALLYNDCLVVADVHLGVEQELIEKGVRVHSITNKIKDELVSIIDETKARKLIFAGDLKHNIPVATEQEFRELPGFLRDLQRLVEVIIVKGNHDGNIERFSNDIKVYGAEGLRIGDLGVIHGHAWPAEEVMSAKYLAIGHNHPQVEFRDKLGRRYAEKAWVIGNLSKGKAKVIVMPAFSPLVGGISFNKVECKDLLGPIFKNELFKLDDAKVRLLNGIELGKIRNLKVS